MDKLNTIRAAICGGAGAIGSFVASMFGGWSSDLSTLVIFMAVDYATGLIAAAMCRSGKTESGGLSSAVGWAGLAKKVITLLLVLVAYRLDLALGVTWVKTAVVIAFIANELISLTENAGLLGVPLPGPIKKAIDMLKEKEDE